MRALLLLLMLPGLASADGVISLSPTQNPNARYRLFATHNMYSFLHLDTQTGFLVRVQWGTGKAETFLAPVFSSCPGLAGDDPNSHPGRYTLEPTTNIWNFLMLDQDTGRVWQLQWTVDGKNDLCQEIRLGVPQSKP